MKQQCKESIPKGHPITDPPAAGVILTGHEYAQYLMTLVSKWESELWESDVVNRTYKILN